MQKRTLSRILAIFILATLTLATQCFGAETSQFSTNGPNGTKAQLELATVPLKTMTSIPFVLTIQKASGVSLADLDFTCDLTMPAMPMPKNQPKVKASSEHYTGEMVFTMAGAWQATFSTRDADGSGIRLVFDIPEVFLK